MIDKQDFKFPSAAELLIIAKEFYPDAAGKIHNLTVEQRTLLDRLSEKKFQSLIPNIANSIVQEAKLGEVIFTIYRKELTYDFYDYYSEQIALKLYRHFKCTDYTVQIIRENNLNSYIEVRLYLIAPETSLNQADRSKEIDDIIYGKGI